MLDAPTWLRIVREARLSEKQAQVVSLMMRGLGDKQIGDALGIRYGTVRMHRERALGRLELDGANLAEVTSRVFGIAWDMLRSEPCPRCRQGSKGQGNRIIEQE
ncbi:MAG: hypothetical protein IT438_16730 [Phycisphaerales bacterium]|nr:hypothetical protein [Phycisphaerales bacterium]